MEQRVFYNIAIKLEGIVRNANHHLKQTETKNQIDFQSQLDVGGIEVILIGLSVENQFPN